MYHAIRGARTETVSSLKVVSCSSLSAVEIPVLPKTNNTLDNFKIFSQLKRI